jgi:hypothetical protein
MTTPLLLPSQTAIESIAYAGVDLPVHLVLSHASGASRSERHLLVIDYPAFSRLLRNRIPRKAAILLLSQLGTRPTTDTRTGLRNWVHIHLNQLMGEALQVAPIEVANRPSLAA